MRFDALVFWLIVLVPIMAAVIVGVSEHYASHSTEATRLGSEKAPTGKNYCHVDAVVSTEKDHVDKVTSVYVDWQRVEE